jgi:cytochrome P460
MEIDNSAKPSHSATEESRIAHTPTTRRIAWIVYLLFAVLTVAGVIAFTPRVSGQSEGDSSPIYGIKIPAGYRDWPVISVARVGAPLNDLRAKLGNEAAMRAFRDGKRPFPDGTIIARIAWNQVTSEESNKVLGAAALGRGSSPDAVQKLLSGTFVAGPVTNLEFMVKDSKKYASTGGWGFAQFNDGKPADEAVHKTCNSCHEPAKDRDFVFTHYAP